MQAQLQRMDENKVVLFHLQEVFRLSSNQYLGNCQTTQAGFCRQTHMHRMSIQKKKKTKKQKPKLAYLYLDIKYNHMGRQIS